MAAINRVGSPMDICKENLEETRDIVAQKKKKLLLKQRTRSPFMIGSIHEVNKRVSKLDKKLQGYTELVCESRASDVEENPNIFPESAERSGCSAQYLKRIRETKDVNKFAGIYTLKSTFVPGLSERARNISKISMQPSKTVNQVSKKDSGKPKFVELHQYPGFDPQELTPLPDDIPAVDMLQKATAAHMNLNKKPQYQQEFKRLFYSDLSQSILQDMFWYIFLEKFQASKTSQIKLFNRVAHNFVKLMMFPKDQMYKDVFFKEYPNLMSQALYAAYCFSFPDSYRQFGEQFKDDLVALVFEWMSGICVAPRFWLSWNFDELEPPNIKIREEILKQKKKKSTIAVNFDFLDSLISSNASQYTSQQSLNQSCSKSSVGSIRGGRPHRNPSKRYLHKTSSPQKVPSSPVADPQCIDTVADAQKSSVTKTQSGDGKTVDPRNLTEALTPIREMGEEESEFYQKYSNTALANQSRLFQKKPVESHPACKGADFVRTVFDVHGRSPLVAHFMRIKKLTPESGMSIRVQRTELEDLPSLDAPTYRDVIRESFKNVRNIAAKFQSIHEKNTKANAIFMKKQRSVRREHQARQANLLSKPNEIKRLSDLLILEQRKGQDSISAGADAAIEAALLAAN